jgi:hypothetical protein
MGDQEKRWDDLEWCNHQIKPEALSDEELREALQHVHPEATVRGWLLYEASNRCFPEAAALARAHLHHPDGLVHTAASKLLGAHGDASDLPALLAMVDDHRGFAHLSVVLEAIVRLDPSRTDFALEIADRLPVDWVSMVRESLALVLPDDFPNLEERLLEWAADERVHVGTRLEICRRLVLLPWSERIEAGLRELQAMDDGSERELTKLVSEALRSGSERCNL